MPGLNGGIRGGRLRLSLVLTAFGLFSIYNVFTWLFLSASKFGFTWAQLGVNIFSFLGGVLMSILAIDILISQTHLNRHINELGAAFFAYSLSNMIFLSVVFYNMTLHGFLTLNFDLLSNTIMVLTGFYIAGRVLIKRPIISKSTLILLSLYSFLKIEHFISDEELLRYLIFFTWRLIDLRGLTMINNLIIYTITCLFFLYTALSKNKRGMRQVVFTLPKYLRLAIFLFGSSFLLEIINEVSDLAFWVNVSFYSSYVATPIFNAFIGLSIIWASFYTWRIPASSSSIKEYEV